MYISAWIKKDAARVKAASFVGRFMYRRLIGNGEGRLFCSCIYHRIYFLAGSSFADFSSACEGGGTKSPARACLSFGPFRQGQSQSFLFI